MTQKERRDFNKQYLEKFASKEEAHFNWYVEELLAAGYIKKAIYQPRPFTLHLGDTFVHETVLKTKIRKDERELTKKHTYGPDWKIVWEKPAKHIFYRIIEETNNPYFEEPFFAQKMFGHPTSFIDVKGAQASRFQTNSSDIRFPLNQKWLWEQEGIFVNKTMVSNKKGIFQDSFTPKRYLKSDIDEGERKLHYVPHNLRSYIDYKRAKVLRILTQKDKTKGLDKNLLFTTKH